MEDITYSELISKHLCPMHETRKAFIEAESNDKLCQALKTKTKVATGIVYDYKINTNYIIKEKILKSREAQVKS